MPFFEYTCEKCGKSGERLVVTDRDRTCQQCDASIDLGERVVAPGDNIMFNISSCRAYYDAALGCEVTGPRKRRDIMRERGLVALDGASPESVKPAEKEIGSDREFTEVYREVVNG